jgi:chromosome segregation ATPase
MIFTDDQQKEHREAFIRECRQKAWGARCHADWVSTGLDKILAEYEKLKAEDVRHVAEIKKLEGALDHHTADNRAKRKGLQEKRNAIGKTMEALGRNMQQGQQALGGLYQSVQASLELAMHAEGWGWVDAASDSM